MWIFLQFRHNVSDLMSFKKKKELFYAISVLILLEIWLDTGWRLCFVWKNVVSGPTRHSDPGTCPTWQSTVPFCLGLARGYFDICLTEIPHKCFKTVPLVFMFVLHILIIITFIKQNNLVFMKVVLRLCCGDLVNWTFVLCHLFPPHTHAHTLHQASVTSSFDDVVKGACPHTLTRRWQHNGFKADVQEQWLQTPTDGHTHTPHTCHTHTNNAYTTGCRTEYCLRRVRLCEEHGNAIAWRSISQHGCARVEAITTKQSFRLLYTKTLWWISGSLSNQIMM